MSVNPARGDVELVLGTARYVLRPSFSAIVILEEHFNRGIFDIAKDFCEGKLNRARDFLSIIRAGIEGAGMAPPDDLPERMAQAGLASLVPVLGKFLAHACGIRA